MTAYSIRFSVEVHGILLPDLDLSDFKTTKEMDQHIANEAFKEFINKAVIWPLPVGIMDLSETTVTLLVDPTVQFQRDCEDLKENPIG